MPEHRRQFSPQFKAEAVQMVIETGKPVAEVARDLVHDGTLGNWVNAWRRERIRSRTLQPGAHYGSHAERLADREVSEPGGGDRHEQGRPVRPLRL